jgi:hypothetical protein
VQGGCHMRSSVTPDATNPVATAGMNLWTIWFFLQNWSLGTAV